MAIKLHISRHTEKASSSSGANTKIVVEKATTSSPAKNLPKPKKKIVLKEKNVAPLPAAKKSSPKKSVIKKEVSSKEKVKEEFLLSEGDPFPEFSLHSSDGGSVSKKSLHGDAFVLYFYPKDMTPGCTTEAHEFSLLSHEFAHLGYRIFGVSADSLERHKKFILKEHITFPLLSDEHKLLAEACGVLGKGIARTTFVVDKKGVITKIYRKVEAKGHSVCVYKDLSIKMP